MNREDRKKEREKQRFYFSKKLERRRLECGFKTQGEFRRAFNLERKKEEGINAKGIYQQTVSDWHLGASLPDVKNLKTICSVLNVNENYFKYKVENDKYKFDSLFIDEIGTELYDHAREIGLNPSFIYAIRELVNFDSVFPCWSPIGITKTDITDLFIHQRPKYGRLENWAESASASEGSAVQKLQVLHDGKLITLNLNDLDYLYDVQQSVIEFVGYLFYKRALQMKEEVNEANRAVNNKDRIPGPLSAQELNKIDHYGKYKD